MIAAKKSPAAPREEELARRVVRSLSERGWTVSAAESCTGGLIAKLMTDIPGSSAVFAGGCVSYTNDVKMRVLGVPRAIIERDTEVSPSCAMAMADGARRLFKTDLAVSATGFAGPAGGTPRDPVGTVYIGLSTPHGTTCVRLSADPSLSRGAIRTAAAARALEELLKQGFGKSD